MPLGQGDGLEGQTKWKEASALQGMPRLIHVTSHELMGFHMAHQQTTVCRCSFSFFSHLKLHRHLKRTCCVEVEVACFNNHNNLKQKSVFAPLAQPEALALFFTFHTSPMWIRHYSESLTDNGLDFSTLWLHSCPMRSSERPYVFFGWHSNKQRLILQMMAGCERWNYYSTISGGCVYLSTRMTMQGSVLISATCFCTSNP